MATTCPMASIFILALIILKSSATSKDVKLVRGVDLKFQSFYSSSKDFTCLDGSSTIPFSSVNDDYCDCPDGTDEPGTSACPEGKYYCHNIGYKPKYIPSSRVNDGLCDCCDGSDEYDSDVACFNNCEKFGLEEQEMRKEEMADTIEGSKIRTEYIQVGKERKEEKKARVEAINGLLVQRMKELEEAKATKEAAEVPETEAKDKHNKEWDEIQVKLKAVEDSIERNAAFDVLDSNKDGWISSAELLSHYHLESDLSESETMDMLSGETMVDKEGLVNVWKAIKPKYLKDGRPDPSQFDESDRDDKPLPEAAEKDKKEGEEKAGELRDDIPLKSDSSSILPKKIIDAKKEMKKIIDHDDDDDDDDEEEEDDRDGYKSAENYIPEGEGGDDEDDEEDKEDKEDKEDSSEDSHQDTKEERPDYDESTKTLIETADNARTQFDAMDKTVKELENEKKDLESYLEIDFGGHDEFSTLKGECYEFTDREYVYKFCPFEKVTQRSKEGSGSETELGNKMTWSGRQANRFNAMKYDGGQSCWNGPARSTLVHLSCGKENVVTSVGEPSRCEYEMTFKTPALCDNVAEHDEL